MGCRHHKLIYASSYDRGLQHLLKIWPEVVKKYPDATLDVFYGWNLFDTAFRNNPERMNWKDRMNEQMKSIGVDMPIIIMQGSVKSFNTYMIDSVKKVE